MAWRGDIDESVESYMQARTAALRFAQFINLACDALTKR